MRPSHTAVGAVSGAILVSLIAELLAQRATSLLGVGLAVLTAALYWLLPRSVKARRIRRAFTDPTPPADDHPDDDVLGRMAAQAGHLLETMGTEGGGMIAAEWFERNESILRAILDTTDPTPDRIDNLALIGDAMEAWYVRQRDGAALLDLSERLTTIGEHTDRPDLRRLAAIRAATAHRLLGDLDAAVARLATAPSIASRDRVAAALRTRYRLERGLVHLTRADRCEPGADRDDAIEDARISFDEAGLTVPRADLAADIAIHVNLAVTYLYQNDPEVALDHLRLASARAAAARDASANAHVLELKGVAAWLQGHHEEATGWWWQAEQHHADIDERVGRARCLQHLGAAALADGDATTALALLERSALLRGDTTEREVLDHYLAEARATLRPPASAPHRPAPRPRDDVWARLACLWRRFWGSA